MSGYRVYQPPGPVAAAFHASDAFVRFLLGPLGSGKSSSSFCELLRLAYAQAPGPDGRRRTRWGIIRNTYGELQTTTLRTVQFWLPVGRLTMAAPFTYRLVTGEVDIEFVFLAIDRPDDIKRLLSLELTGCWLNEVRELPKAVLDMCTGRVGRFPAMIDGGPTWSGIIADTNMPDGDHWIYKLAEEERPEGFAFFRQPGAMRWDDERWVPNPAAENAQNLPPGYYQRQVAGKAEAWIKVYLAAEYGYVGDDKAVWPQFVDSVHVAKGRLQALPSALLVAGIDFGLTPASAICQQMPNGRWLVLSELVSDDMGAVRFGQRLKQHLAQIYPDLRAVAYGDPAGGQRSQVTEETAFEAISRHAGISCHSAGSNDYLLRVEAVAAALTRMVDGGPGLLIDPSCNVLRKALAGGYAYRRMALSANDERYTDRPVKNAYSHVAESLQYAILGAGGIETVLPPRRADESRGWNKDGAAVVVNTRFDPFGDGPADSWPQHLARPSGGSWGDGGGGWGGF